MKKVWHKEVITKEAENTVKALIRRNALAGFYLAGGTGMALHFGHRRSIDLDFFSREPFDEDRLLTTLHGMRGLTVTARDQQTLHIHLRGTKVSFLGYPYRLLYPLGSLLGMKIADSRDIACMKISAISSRGTKRDFVDLYFAAKEYGLANLIELFKGKFAGTQYSLLHLLKSLTFFEDAEKEPMPDMLADTSWRVIRQFFQREAPRLANTDQGNS